MPDAFTTLGLEPRFDVTGEAVERAYLRRAAAVHPDRGDDDGVAAAELNLAREVLANPESRANALLARLGGPGAGQDKSLPSEFLVEMMEVREAIEAARSDAAESARWVRWADERRAEYVARLTGLFAASPPVLAEIRRELNAWRYIERLIEQLDPSYDPARGGGF